MEVMNDQGLLRHLLKVTTSPRGAETEMKATQTQDYQSARIINQPGLSISQDYQSVGLQHELLIS
jgi:hypothetical protein